MFLFETRADHPDEVEVIMRRTDLSNADIDEGLHIATEFGKKKLDNVFA